MDFYSRCQNWRVKWDGKRNGDGNEPIKNIISAEEQASLLPDKIIGRL
jgi:hypothetical protein